MNRMKRLRVYLDTSVLNFALAKEPSLATQKKATLDLLTQIRKKKYEGYISEIVITEIDRASKVKAKLLNDLVGRLNLESLPFSEEVKELADRYIAEGIIPSKYRDDALHIAVASVNNLDAVVSWNFEHMVKLKTKQGVVAVNTLLGYKAIEIVSPQEVV